MLCTSLNVQVGVPECPMAAEFCKGSTNAESAGEAVTAAATATARAESSAAGVSVNGGGMGFRDC